MDEGGVAGNEAKVTLEPGQLVGEDGYMFYPYVGMVKAAGMNVAALRDVLSTPAPRDGRARSDESMVLISPSGSATVRYSAGISTRPVSSRRRSCPPATTAAISKTYSQRNRISETPMTMLTTPQNQVP